MSEDAAERAREVVDRVYRSESRRVLATLIRLTCCHPALPPEAQAALTLREVCDLTTEEIARAFLAATPTVAQRIVLAHAARADLCRRLGRAADARASYEEALRLTRQEPERRFLARRLAELTD